MANDILGQVGEIIDNLKRQQLPGETPLETMRRIFRVNEINVNNLLTSQTIVSAIPPMYRFKTFPDMNILMIDRYGEDWQSMVAVPGLLRCYLGVCPSDPNVQNEMHKIYNSKSDQTFGKINIDGRTLNFCRLMIEPVG